MGGPGGTMRLGGHAVPMLLLLNLGLLGMVVEVQGQEGGYLQEALQVLAPPLGTQSQVQLQRNQTGLLLSTLLHVVRCAERIGGSQELCDRVRPGTFYKTIITAVYFTVNS